jgi:hypothetical protein
MCDYERSAGCGKQSLRYQCNEMKDCKHKIYIIQQQDIALRSCERESPRSESLSVFSRGMIATNLININIII